MKNKSSKKNSLKFLAILASATALFAVGCGGDKKPDPTVSAIDAVFEQGDLVIWTTTDLETLKDVLTVYEVYTDETTVEIADANYTISGTLTEGVSTILVTYGEYSDSFDVTVLRLQETDIEATYTQGETVVYDNATLDSLKASLEVKVNKNDGTSYALTADQYTLSGELTAGESTITVTYGDFTDTFTVNVTAVAPVSIDAVYTQGEAVVYTSATLDSLKSALAVTLTKNNGDTANVAVADVTLSGTLTAGESTITVTYGDFTDTITVNVTAVAPVSIEATYTQGNTIINEGDSLDSLKEALTVTLTNNDGSTANVAVADVTISGDLVDGESTITVTYGDFTDTITVNVGKWRATLANTYAVEATSFAAGINYDAYLPTEITEEVAVVKLNDTAVNFTQDGKKLIVVSDATSLGAVGSATSVSLTIETATTVYSGMTVNVSTVAWGNAAINAQVVAEAAGQKTSFADGKVIIKLTPVGSGNMTLSWQGSGLAEYFASLGYQTFGMKYYLSEDCADGNGMIYDAGIDTWYSDVAYACTAQGAWTQVKRLYGNNGTASSLSLGDVNGLALSHLALTNTNAGCYGSFRFGWTVSAPTSDAYIMFELSKVPAILTADNEQVTAAVIDEYQGMSTDLENGKVLVKINFSGNQKELCFATAFENYLKSLGEYSTFGMQYYIAGGADNAALYFDCGTGNWPSVPNATKNAWTQASYFNGTQGVPFELRDINTLDVGTIEGNKYTAIRMGWANAGTTPHTEVYLYITLRK